MLRNLKNLIAKKRNKALYRWLGISKDMIVLPEEKKWLANAWEEEGFKSFIAFRDVSLLKELGQGLDWNEYNHYLGRRKELLFLAGEAKKQYEVRELNKKINQ